MSSEIVDRRQRSFIPAAVYDVFLPLYDPLVGLFGFDRARRELISQANVQPDQDILDIGCGTGTLVVMLKRQFAPAQIIGLDPDPKALRRAKIKARRAAVSVQLDQGFADELPYKNESFDRVFSSFMFHHLDDEHREKTLREVLRVLKPAGAFHLLDVVADREADGYLERLFHSHAQLKDNTPERILQLMQREGFKNAAQVKDGRLFFGLLRIAYFRGTR
jgi:ubiquinone/menaquinone biosynthesis C-methylase UbiE